MKKTKRGANGHTPVEPDDVPRVTITLTDESVYLTRHDRTGAPAATYPVTAASVANAFNLFGASTGLLPPNTLFWQSRSGQLRIGVWIEPGVRTLSIRRKRLEQWRVPLPGFVFVGNARQYAVFAAAGRPTQASDRVYHCPLPNVYLDGHICAGDVPFPRCTPETMSQAVALFFESEFNHDLAGQGMIELLKSLRGKGEFPIDRLRPAGTMSEIMTEGRAKERDDDDDDLEPYADGIDPYELAYDGVNDNED